MSEQPSQNPKIIEITGPESMDQVSESRLKFVDVPMSDGQRTVVVGPERDRDMYHFKLVEKVLPIEDRVHAREIKLYNAGLMRKTPEGKWKIFGASGELTGRDGGELMRTPKELKNQWDKETAKYLNELMGLAESEEMFIVADVDIDPFLK